MTPEISFTKLTIYGSLVLINSSNSSSEDHAKYNLLFRTLVHLDLAEMIPDKQSI